MKRLLASVIVAGVMVAQIPGPPPTTPPTFPPTNSGPNGGPGAPPSNGPLGANQGPEDPADAANHGVARLSLVQGNVSVTHGDAAADSTAGVLNAPDVSPERVDAAGED